MSPRFRRFALALAVGGLALPLLSASGAQTPPVASLKIEIGWKGDPALADVKFDGGASFAKEANYFVASQPVDGSSQLRDIALDFGQFQMPLRVLASAQRKQDIEFTVAAPAYTQCDMGEVNTLWNTATSGTIDERVALLIRARRLIGLCENLTYEHAKLVRKYYEVSCSLAGDRDTFFAIHSDASELFAKLPPSLPKTATLNSCRGRGIGGEVKLTWDAAKKAQLAGDSRTLAALTDDLLAKAGDADWHDGFAAESLTPDLVRELKVVGLKAQQNTAAENGQIDRALELNAKLKALHEEGDYAAVFDKVGVNEKLLDSEHDFFEARRASLEGH